MNAVCGQEVYDIKEVKAKFVQSSDFDPNAFFFLTYRSHAIGLCLAWPLGNKEFEIKNLTSIPSHRNKGVELALINLALGYCKTQNAAKAFVRFDETPILEF